MNDTTTLIFRGAVHQTNSSSDHVLFISMPKFPRQKGCFDINRIMPYIENNVLIIPDNEEQLEYNHPIFKIRYLCSIYGYEANDECTEFENKMEYLKLHSAYGQAVRLHTSLKNLLKTVLNLDDVIFSWLIEDKDEDEDEEEDNKEEEEGDDKYQFFPYFPGLDHQAMEKGIHNEILESTDSLYSFIFDDNSYIYDYSDCRPIGKFENIYNQSENESALVNIHLDNLKFKVEDYSTGKITVETFKDNKLTYKLGLFPVPIVKADNSSWYLTDTGNFCSTVEGKPYPLNRLSYSIKDDSIYMIDYSNMGWTQVEKDPNHLPVVGIYRVKESLFLVFSNYGKSITSDIFRDTDFSDNILLRCGKDISNILKSEGITYKLVKVSIYWTKYNIEL